MTRRAAVASAAGLALAGLVGCAQGDDAPGQGGGEERPAGSAPEWSGGYLPVGSAVRLKGMPDGFEHVVVSRRPEHSGSAAVRDYALVQAVLGITSDLAGDGGLYKGEIVLADESDIAEVLHVGRVTDEEERAEVLLEAGRGTDEAGVELLLPIIEDRAGALGEAADAGR